MSAHAERTFADLVTDERELLLFAMTPPRATTSAERAQEIADATLTRLDGLDVDALILYDLDDESDRTDDDRPFPYLETMDPADFLAGPLAGWDGNAIVYRCVGKYDEAREDLEKLKAAGVDIDEVTALLEREGVDKFIVSWHELTDTVAKALESA